MKLLNVVEAAELLGESIDSTYRLARLGLIPSVRIGRKVKFSESRLIAFIEAGGNKTINNEQEKILNKGA